MEQKNFQLMGLASIMVLISLIVHTLYRFLALDFLIHSEHMMVAHNPLSVLLVNVLLGIPLLTLVLTGILYRFNTQHALIPWLNTLTLTFSSISIIAGGLGASEFHFSVLLILVIITVHFDQKKIQMLMLSATLFAVYHIAGLFLFPEIVYGIMSYNLSMMAIHIVFVLLFVGVGIHHHIGVQQKMNVIESEQDEKVRQTVFNIMEGITRTGEQLLIVSNELMSRANNSKQSSSEIAAVVEETTENAELQKHSTAETSKTMEEMSQSIQRIAETTATISEASMQSTNEAEEGNESIQKVVKQMESISKSVHDSAATIKLLGERSQEIGAIINLITDIAAQTNLLALNAAIEAARAGEQGKGFAVVADEVRKLAEQSEKSAQEIDHLVKEIQHEANRSVTSMDGVIHEVEGGLDVVHKSGEAFQSILKSIKSVAEQILDASAISEQMSASTEEVTASVAEMSAAINELADNVQNINSATQSQLATIDESSALAGSLKDISNELNNLIEKSMINLDINKIS